jgi:hypothetical protein
MKRMMQQGIAIVILMVLALTTQAQKTTTSKYKPVEHNYDNYGNEYLNVDDDSSVNPVQTIVSYCHGRDKYDFTLAADKIIELYVNNRKIPADSFYVYNSLIDGLKEQIKRDRAQAIEDRKQAELDRQQAVRDQVQAEEDRKQAERDRQQAELDRQQAVRDQAQAEEDRKQAIRDQAEAEQERKQAEEDRKQAELDRQQAVRDQAQAEEDRKQAELDRKQAEEDRKMMESLVNDLIAEHIVPDKQSVKRVELNEDEFIVNGKLQSAELLKKFKAKYIKKPGYSFTYGGYTSGYGIHYYNN